MKPERVDQLRILRDAVKDAEAAVTAHQKQESELIGGKEGHDPEARFRYLWISLLGSVDKDSIFDDGDMILGSTEPKIVVIGENKDRYQLSFLLGGSLEGTSQTIRSEWKYIKPGEDLPIRVDVNRFQHIEYLNNGSNLVGNLSSLTDMEWSVNTYQETPIAIQETPVAVSN